MTFSVNGIQGTADHPYVWSNPTLSNEADMLTFSISGESMPAVISKNTIALEMPYGTTSSQLISNYTTSPNAITSVGGELHMSGVNTNNYLDSVKFQVLSADESISNT